MNSHRTPAILKFAEPEKSPGESNSIYKYLTDTGFDENEVKSWGTIGSLKEALDEKDIDNENYQLDNSFIEFISKLPCGNTPRPFIRQQLQRLV